MVTKANNIRDKEEGRDDDPEPHDSRPATKYDWFDAKYHEYDNQDEDYKPAAS